LELSFESLNVALKAQNNVSLKARIKALKARIIALKARIIALKAQIKALKA
jgi:cell division protein FtsB